MLRRLALALAAFAGAGASCPDAPEALDAFPVSAPVSVTSVVAGVTAAGEGRARLALPTGQNGVNLGNGFIGLRARVSTDGGATFVQQPADRVSHAAAAIVVGGLAVGDNVVEVVAVNNLGIEGSASGPVTVTVPAATVPTIVTSPQLAVRPAAGGLQLSWVEPSTAAYATDVLRSVDGGEFVVVATVDAPVTSFFSAETRGTWRLVTEDVHGNRSAPSNDVTLEVP